MSNNANIDESPHKKDSCPNGKNKSYENIKFFFNEPCEDDPHCANDLDSPLNSDDMVNIETLLYNFEQITLSNNTHDDYTAALISHYNENYNIKELLKICEYYGIHKTLNKSKKIDIVYFIIIFENSEENYNIVLKRKQSWYYMNELKQDKQMKKYLLW
jgi:hypothetical protein